MSRIFITGSSDGLGLLAGLQLIEEGHEVTFHARNKKRAEETARKVPEGYLVLIADLTNMDEVKFLAEQVNNIGHFDAIIHNAGVYQASGDTIVRVNVLAPYLLSCLINKPKRLIYMSSGMHSGGRPKLQELKNDWSKISYSDSKLHDVILANAVARWWPDVFSNSVDPGWVPTKMGGKNAPDDLTEGYRTQTWLAMSEDNAAMVSGRYFHHKRERNCNPAALDISIQDEFLKVCEELTGIAFSN